MHFKDNSTEMFAPADLTAWYCVRPDTEETKRNTTNNK